MFSTIYGDLTNLAGSAEVRKHLKRIIEVENEREVG